MDRNPDRTGLIGDRAGDRLADPPRCVSGELVALCIIEFVNGANQAGVALLNQVQDVEAASGILFRNRYDQSKVRLGQFFLGLFIAFGNLLREVHFLLSGKKRNLTDFF